MGIIINPYKDPHSTTQYFMESMRFFFLVAQVTRWHEVFSDGSPCKRGGGKEDEANLEFPSFSGEPC